MLPVRVCTAQPALAGTARSLYGATVRRRPAVPIGELRAGGSVRVAFVTVHTNPVPLRLLLLEVLRPDVGILFGQSPVIFLLQDGRELQVPIRTSSFLEPVNGQWQCSVVLAPDATQWGLLRTLPLRSVSLEGVDSNGRVTVIATASDPGVLRRLLRRPG